VWNSSQSKSYLVDLGTAWSDLTSTSTFKSESGYSKTWSVDTSVSKLVSDLGGSPDNFSVFAYNNDSQPYLFRFGINGSTAPVISTPNLQNNAVPSVSSFINTHGGTSFTSYLGSTSDPNGNTYWASCSSPILAGCNGGSYNLFAFNNLGAANPTGGSLNFVEYVGGASPRTNATSSFIGNSQHIGAFTFSGNTLTYTLAAVSSVPLPAAAWLLISGLLGFGAVSRRRETAAA
jgi:hypothetical protein